MTTTATQDEKPTNTSNDRLLVNEPEAARLLSLSPRTLFSLRQSGEMPFIQLGRAIRYRVADLYQWIEKNIIRAANAKREG